MLEKVNNFFFLILAIHPDLSVGSLVQFPLDGMKIQGVIKWIGYLFYWWIVSPLIFAGVSII